MATNNNTMLITHNLILQRAGYSLYVKNKPGSVCYRALQ